MPNFDETAVYQNPSLGNVPMIGTSIGVIDSDEIETLELYIKCARKDGVKEIYALTCAHIAVSKLPCDPSGRSTKPCCFAILATILDSAEG